jgi:glycosyltransferase involved in cell wall biosynthesis
MGMKIGIFVTHPIQYFSPIWRQLAATAGVEVMVHFFSDHSVRGGLDPGFGVPVAWDLPILDGYPHRFITRDADLSRPRGIVMADARRLLADGAFDVVMFHGYTHGFERQLLAAAPSLGIKTLMRGEFTDDLPETGRSRLKRWMRNLYLRRFYSQVDAFCYIGARAREHLLSHGVAARCMFFSPYSVDSAQFESQRQRFDRAAVRKEMGIAGNSIAILFSGKLIPRKAPLLLVQAIAKLKDPGRISLIIIGDGELRRQVESEGRALLGARLIMPGFVNQSELGRYFSAADLFVLPSIFETWGLVVNEAMQFGLPAVVSRRVGCHQDLVIEGKTGFTFESGDAAGLAGAIDQFFSATADRAKMGHAAHDHIALYSTERSVAGILDAMKYLESTGAR